MKCSFIFNKVEKCLTKHRIKTQSRAAGGGLWGGYLFTKWLIESKASLSIPQKSESKIKRVLVFWGFISFQQNFVNYVKALLSHSFVKQNYLKAKKSPVFTVVLMWYCVLAKLFQTRAPAQIQLCKRNVLVCFHFSVPNPTFFFPHLSLSSRCPSQCLTLTQEAVFMLS